MSSGPSFDQLPLQAGMVALASVRNPLENPNSRGKVRPVVLVERISGHWRVMGLTTRHALQQRSAASARAEPGGVGLRGLGHLWGPRLTSVYALDIDRPIGWCDIALATAVADLAKLPNHLRHELLTAAQLHHPAKRRAA